MRKPIILVLLLWPLLSFSQILSTEPERFPSFKECTEVDRELEEECFKNVLRKKVFEQLDPSDFSEGGEFEGEAVVLFEVTRDGRFEPYYISSAHPPLKQALEEVFQQLSAIAPATYNGRPISMQFRMPISLPLKEDDDQTEDLTQMEKTDVLISQNLDKDSYPLLHSEINIPFSHERYSRFEQELNVPGRNFHTASKPFLYNDVSLYYDFIEERESLIKPADTWLERKLWNEHLFLVRGEDYWFSVDFGLDLQVGKDFSSELDVTYNNTRAAIIQGGLGKDLNFYSVIYESQGRFADYFNEYAESLKPGTEAEAVIPGRGIAKSFMGQAYDFPVAEAYLSYSPSKFFNLQFGHGNQFIGDGYRSLLLGDASSPYPFFKLSTEFWRIKYTNTWMSLRDIRPEVTGEGSYRTKYMANHYLSFNVTDHLNLGFFESVIWENDNDRGFDLNYLNPVIFYRAIEFSTGAQAGNALIGLTAKYRWNANFMTYAQWLIDEFSSGDVFGGEGSWKNKHGFQLGTTYFDALGIDNLQLQVEYNQVRPYTYSHNTITLNYGHNNQSLAHPWGANFRELLFSGLYQVGRYYGSGRIILGQRGMDLENSDFAFGGDIFTNEENRPFENGVEIGQGNTTNIFFSEAEAGYIVNPATNLKFFANVIYRNINPEVDYSTASNSSLWLSIGLRTDLFNWYYDY